MPLTALYPDAFVPVAYWCIAEPSVLILAVSLHAVFQLVRRAYEHGPRALLTTQDYSQLRYTSNASCGTQHESIYHTPSHETNETALSRDSSLTALPQIRNLSPIHIVDDEKQLAVQNSSILVKKDITVSYDTK